MRRIKTLLRRLTGAQKKEPPPPKADPADALSDERVLRR